MTTRPKLLKCFLGCGTSDKAGGKHLKLMEVIYRKPCIVFRKAAIHAKTQHDHFHSCWEMHAYLKDM